MPMLNTALSADFRRVFALIAFRFISETVNFAYELAH